MTMSSPNRRPDALASSGRTCSSRAPHSDRTCTDLNSLCYNSFTGQGQLLWVRVACSTVLDPGIHADCARKADKLSTTDTLEKNPLPEAAEAALSTESSHEGHDHHEHDHHDHEGHDHDHAHQHGPVLNPECTRELVIDVPADEVAKSYGKVVGNYRKYAKIPGFRAGKVPESVIKRRFATEIRKDVIDGLLPQRFNKAVAELGVKPVGQPQVTELTVEDGAPLHVKAVFEYVPGFSIEGYKDVTVPKPPVDITDEEFKAELAQLRESRATVEPVEEDRPLVDGDWAQITYKGQVEGDETAAPISGEDTLVEIGGKDTVEAFSAALRGAKPGQELKAEVIYPADYSEARLAGKTVAYEVEVKAIKKRTLPELDDDFAKELGAYESLADLEERVREHLASRKRLVERLVVHRLAVGLLVRLDERRVVGLVDRRVLVQQGRVGGAGGALEQLRLVEADRLAVGLGPREVELSRAQGQVLEIDPLDARLDLGGGVPLGEQVGVATGQCAGRGAADAWQRAHSVVVDVTAVDRNDHVVDVVRCGDEHAQLAGRHLLLQRAPGKPLGRATARSRCCERRRDRAVRAVGQHQARLLAQDHLGQLGWCLPGLAGGGEAHARRRLRADRANRLERVLSGDPNMGPYLAAKGGVVAPDPGAGHRAREVRHHRQRGRSRDHPHRRRTRHAAQHSTSCSRYRRFRGTACRRTSPQWWLSSLPRNGGGLLVRSWSLTPGTCGTDGGGGVMPVEVTRAGAILAVSDFARSVDFYRDQLGFEVEALYEDPPYATLVHAGARLSLAEQGHLTRTVQAWSAGPGRSLPARGAPRVRGGGLRGGL